MELKHFGMLFYTYTRYKMCPYMCIWQHMYLTTSLNGLLVLFWWFEIIHYNTSIVSHIKTILLMAVLAPNTHLSLLFKCGRWLISCSHLQIVECSKGSVSSRIVFNREVWCISLHNFIIGAHCRSHPCCYILISPKWQLNV